MEVDVPIPISPISRDQFQKIDRIVMNCVYASHNRLGNLCDETVYENDLAARLRAEGIHNVTTQVPVTLSHHDFKKLYRLDLVVDQMVYELKAESAISPAHESQALNYAALLGLNRIKLLNFGGDSVAGKLLGAPFAELDRYEINIQRSKWHPIGPECEALANRAEQLTHELGGFLSSELYRDALVHLTGGEQACTKRIPVTRDKIQLGTQRVFLHSTDCAFLVTSIGKGLQTYAKHLRTLLPSLPLKAFQWINIHHRNVHLITIS